MNAAAICSSIAVLAMLTVGHATAATAPAKEGSSEGLTCYAGPTHAIVDGKGQIASSYDLIGTPIRKEGELFYLSSNHCVGLFTLVGKELSDSGSCLNTDSDGDHVFVVYSRRNQEAGVWKAVSGTGKFEGIEASGTWVNAVRPGKQDRPGYVQVCNRDTATWKLK